MFKVGDEVVIVDLGPYHADEVVDLGVKTKITKITKNNSDIGIYLYFFICF